MDSEKCPVCGASVKKENLKGHYERVHPKRPGSLGQPVARGRQATFLRSHRKRNLAILGLFVLAIIAVSVTAGQFMNARTERMHIHPTVSAVINGTPQVVPAQIGIDASLWKDHSLDQYGIGMAPMHTHDASGQIHTESNTVRQFTLREFLAIWGQTVDASQVLGHPVDPGHRSYLVVDGVERAATEDVVFADGMRIQIVCAPIGG